MSTYLSPPNPIRKLLVANRGEIAIRIFRAASELHIRTIAVYTYEDRYALHRFKADEAYQIGNNDEALKPYLDMDEIIHLALRCGADAIHPGYGFLSENVAFAQRCQQEGIIFVGPRPEVMAALGDKLAAKRIARSLGIPVIEDNQLPLTDVGLALQEAHRIGYPLILKAAAGGGGRGMRVVHDDEQLQKAFEEARREAGRAFADDTLFMERYVPDPKHIEVQILGDNYGNIVHLYERDCSVQRRFQKVVEIAPAPVLAAHIRQQLYDYALRIARHVNYNNAGTVEFLVDAEQNIYFIEVNPRIQVEHTITEEITGIDLVRSQIEIARGYRLSDPPIWIRSQDDIRTNGFAIQCRITTEDPQNDFKPDFGTLIAYRTGTGFGIRLDEGSAYAGARISPFFDSMLVKVSASGRTLKGAAQRLHRALREFRIRGVKTNIGFLLNVIAHPVFQRGEATVGFIQQHPELFNIEKRLDRGTRALRYLAQVSVNGCPDLKNKTLVSRTFKTPRLPQPSAANRFADYPPGSRQRLIQLGRDAFVEWLKQEKSIQFTDTTLRDAHQSLLATRLRTIDMLPAAACFARQHPQTFSMEVWGGATFDTALRFLKECPWQRLRLIRKAVPNILLQMLLRGSNAVGYKAYPDNLIEKFIEKAAEEGIDLFRIFDSLNYLENLKVSIRAVRQYTNSLAEVAICYTGDLQNPERSRKYNLQYYLDLARRIEDEGAHILAIKDMAGLLKPYAAEMLVAALKETVSIPIHLHTHDTAAVQSATYLKAIEAGVDVIDVALAAMSGLTSQPNFNAIVAMLKGHPRENAYDLQHLNQLSDYWEAVRAYYYPFESGLQAGTASVYEHEMPGGQYSNLKAQAEAMGLEGSFELIKQNYRIANELFGDLVKVTPSSKVVGDMAIFMTANGLTAEDILQQGNSLAFPESVKQLMKGELGQPHGGFPEALQKIVLKGEPAYDRRPNEYLEPIDFEQAFADFRQRFGSEYGFTDLLSYCLYPSVFEQYHAHRQQYGDVWYIPTPAFFYGMQDGEEILIHIDEGKTILIKKVGVSSVVDEEGYRLVSFELNGQLRRIRVRDESVEQRRAVHLKATEPQHVGSPLQGKIAEIKVKEGEQVQPNQPLFVIEAMKMESVVAATRAGRIKKIYLPAGTFVEQGDLVLEVG